MIFDERLTELRKEMGVTQKDFAEKLQIEPSKYNKWENGKTVPDFDTVIRLANYFGVTVDYLVGNSDAKKQENENIIKELGLTDKGIATIKNIKASTINNNGNKDNRKLMDVFNQLIATNWIINLLVSLMFLSNSNENNSDFTRFDIDDVGYPFQISENSYYEKALEEILDKIILEMKENTLRG